MKIITTLLFVSALGFFPYAQQPDLANTTLWRLSGNGLKSDSYILLTGTQCTNEFEPTKALQEALSKVQVIAPEYDLHGPEALAQLPIDKYALADSQRLAGQLSATEVNEYFQALKDLGFPDQFIAEFSKYKVSTLWRVLPFFDGPCGTGKDRMIWETALKATAQKKKQQLKTLFTVTEFIQQMNSYTQQHWGDLIRYHLQHHAQAKAWLQAEADLFKAGQLSKLRNLYGNAYYAPIFNHPQTINHNEATADRIKTAAEQAPTLVAISAGSAVAGSNPVFQALRTKGFTITPVIIP